VRGRGSNKNPSVGGYSVASLLSDATIANIFLIDLHLLSAMPNCPFLKAGDVGYIVGAQWLFEYRNVALALC